MIYPSRLGSPKPQTGFLKKPYYADEVDHRLEAKAPHGSYKPSTGVQNSPISKSSNRISSKPASWFADLNEPSPVLQKFVHMKEMVVRLLDEHPIDNLEVNEGLNYLLAILQNITK